MKIKLFYNKEKIERQNFESKIKTIFTDNLTEGKIRTTNKTLDNSYID